MTAWPQRDYQRWHITPYRDQYKTVDAYNVKTRKRIRISQPRICEKHFCTIAECMWSFYMGQGYPLESDRYSTRPYWARMASRNKLWRLREAREGNITK